MYHTISISTEACPHGGDLTILQDTLKLVRQAGFNAVDLSLQGIHAAGSPLLSSSWEKWCSALVRHNEQSGIRFVQAHAPAYNLPSPAVADADEKQAMVMRTIQAAGLLGIEWIVVHPGTDYLASDAENDFQQNLLFFRKLSECAAAAGTGIAIENLFDTYHAPLDAPSGPHSDNRVDRRCISRRRFGSDPSDIRRLADTLSSEGYPVGLCWDTGHAHLSGIRQGKALCALGDRVKVVHFHDNHAFEDSHLTPFAGSVPWQDIMPALTQIGFTGSINLECGGFTNALPRELILSGLSYAHATAQHLLDQMEDSRHAAR